MPITRYDGNLSGGGQEDIQFIVPEGQYAKIIGHTGTGFTLYHNNSLHNYIYDGTGLTITVPASAGTFTGEVASFTRVQVLDLFNQLGGNYIIDMGAGANQFTHTTGTNVFTLGSIYTSLGLGTNIHIRIDWVTHDGSFSVSTAAGNYTSQIGLNSGDHIEIAAAASGDPINSVTVETGLDFRPGNK